jgi:hypothetical protein
VKRELLVNLRRTICRLWHGHDSLLQLDEKRLSLKCVSCGYESPGWDLNERPPTIRHYKLLRFKRRMVTS